MTLNYLSSVATHETIHHVTNGLGAYIRDWRERQGLTLTRAAAEVGVGKGYLSQLETGKIGLPNADVRRRIAEMLGITHVQFLIIAGELREDEVEKAGVTGVRAYSEDDPRAQIIAAVDQVNWYGRPDRVAGLLATLSAYREMDQHYKEIV